MKKRYLPFVLVAAAAIYPVSAEEGAEEFQEPKQELTNEAIEGQKAYLDELLQKRIEAIEREFSEEQTFRVMMKGERIAFERSMLGERKSFLDTLKNMPPDARRASILQFNQRQRESRRKFHESQKKRREDFQSARQGRREEHRQEHKTDREKMKEDRRQKREALKEKRRESRKSDQGAKP
ncbi:MAG: hypothetical protein HYT79_02915 [Elusimicrobia bacterium]|nr:hypothetical protein [Elusimicrobiota bacterium]